MGSQVPGSRRGATCPEISGNIPSVPGAPGAPHSVPPGRAPAVRQPPAVEQALAGGSHHCMEQTLAGGSHHCMEQTLAFRSHHCMEQTLAFRSHHCMEQTLAFRSHGLGCVCGRRKPQMGSVFTASLRDARASLGRLPRVSPVAIFTSSLRDGHLPPAVGQTLAGGSHGLGCFPTHAKKPHGWGTGFISDSHPKHENKCVVRGGN